MTKKPANEELEQRIKDLEKKLACREAEANRALKELHSLEGIDLINDIIHKSSNLDQMMDDVLKTALSIFDCDRVWLMFPCDPDTSHWSVPMEHTTLEYPGVFRIGREIRTTMEMALQFKAALESDGPLVFDPQSKIALPDSARQFSVQSSIIMAIHPRIGKPWLWGVSQCSHPRIWTDIDQMLFRKIGMTIKEALSNLIFLRNLHESEEKFRAIFNQTFQFVGLLSTEGRILAANDTALAFGGLSEKDVLGKFFWETPWWLHDLRQQAMLKNAIHRAAEGEFVRFEAYHPIKDGEIRFVDFSVKPIKDDTGAIIFLLPEGRDITTWKQAEEEKKKALEFAAEQSKNALIGQVAGKMAHDFNNVLMGIMGNAQLAVLDCSDEKTTEKLECISELAKRGKDISNNLMSFAKDHEPKQTYFKIEDKIDLVIKMLEKDLSGINVIKKFKPGIPELLADPGMIQDVLVNLIQNSIHAVSKVENPTLNIDAYSKDDKIYFRVEDNGCGIPKEHQESIYTPSFTLKGSHDKAGAYKSGITGTGYGMSNVKKYVVEKHKGDIYLESEVGEGTRFTVALKVITDYLSADEKKEVVKNEIHAKRRILLVEDEQAIADVQYQILTKEPFQHIVSIAINGQSAIDLFNRNQFDIVSLDYILPGNANGLDVYNHIREKDKDIPVVFISGNIEFLESIKELKEKDPNLDHLTKPIDNLDYVNNINRLIGRRSK